MKDLSAVIGGAVVISLEDISKLASKVQAVFREDEKCVLIMVTLLGVASVAAKMDEVTREEFLSMAAHVFDLSSYELIKPEVIQ